MTSDRTIVCVYVCVCMRRTVVLPCASFCEAAREGCEPVLQMFNASWPDFLRCSQFSSSSPSSSVQSLPLATADIAPSACYTPRQMKGKSCESKCTHAHTLTPTRCFIFVCPSHWQLCVAGRTTSCVRWGSASPKNWCVTATMTVTTGVMRNTVVRKNIMSHSSFYTSFTLCFCTNPIVPWPDPRAPPPSSEPVTCHLS